MNIQKKRPAAGEQSRTFQNISHNQYNSIQADGQAQGSNTQLIREAAVELLPHGFSVIPTSQDKKATIPWKPFQRKCMSINDVQKHFRNGCSLAIVCGEVSGHLECMDFDKPELFKPFVETLRGLHSDLAAKLVKRQTPSGGYHLIYRCKSAIGGNAKLAMSGEGKETWIETRGEGGYFLTAPSPGYSLIEHSLQDTPILTVKELKLLHSLAKSFTEKQESIKHTGQDIIDGTRPGDDYNSKHDASVIARNYGWTETGKSGPGGMHWTRPGKNAGTSATLKDGCLYVFSSSTPLPMGPNDAFSIFTHYTHDGDFSAAAKELVRQGYGRASSSSMSTDKYQDEEWEASVPEWPELDNKALSGIAGEFVALATENSEADPAAVLATFLVRFGVEVGSKPVMWIGDTPHRARLASVIVGSSSKARKGTSGKPVTKLFDYNISEDYPPPARTTPGPFSSGEGIIYAVRDKIEKWSKEKGERQVVDPGVEDKRLFILDEEFSGVMANTKREGNTLSMIIRTAWDSGNLDPLTKTTKIRATGAHVGWVSHITLFELNKRLADSEAFNGFANRILWVCAKRKKLVALPEPMENGKLSLIQSRIIELVDQYQEEMKISLDEKAKQVWVEQYYPTLTKDHPGLIGCVINRAEAQVLRLAMIYCLLDGHSWITVEHLESALAFWNYCRQSAGYIFHGRQSDTVGQKILNFLHEGAKTATEIHRLFGGHVSKNRLETAISELLASDSITVEKKPTRGRSTTIYKIQSTLCVKSGESGKSSFEEKRKEILPLNALNALNSQSEWEDV